MPRYYVRIHVLKTEEIDVEAKDYADAKAKALDAYANNKTYTRDEEVDEVEVIQE